MHSDRYDYSDKPLPQTGDRLRNFAKFKENADAKFPALSTHVRWGDWQVSQVEEYIPKMPIAQYDSLVVCYCRYSPNESEWKELPKILVSQLQEFK